MTRFYLRLSFILILLFTVCGVTLSALGSTQPIHPALRGFVEGCEGIAQPCWYGIVPGVTTYEQAVSILERNGYSFSYGGNLPEAVSATFSHSIGEPTKYCDQISLEYDDQTQQETILSLSPQYCQDIYLLDFLALFDSEIENLSQNYFGQVLFLLNGQIKVFWNDLEPYSLSTGIHLINPQAYLGEPFRWHGFAPLWRYCQLEPQNDLCL